jgi:hypothetical protein
MSTALAVERGLERYVRACPDHLEELAELECPRGHRVERWVVLDLVKNTVVGGGDVEPSRGRMTMPRGVPGSGPAPTKPGTKSIDRRAFRAPSGATMLITLLRQTFKDGPLQVRVKWVMVKGVGAQATQGYRYSGLSEPEAHGAFVAAEKEALAQGWVPRILGREPEIKPIPPAPRK